jgi:probable rRNA maturation factor
VAVEVFGADEQPDHPVDLDRYVSLTRFALEEQGVPGRCEVSLFFVDEAAITTLNERFLGKKGPTDVLSFPLEDEPIPSGRFPDAGTSGPGFDDGEGAQPTLLLGDIVICPAVAAANAVEHEVTSEQELSLLVVHGVLHLLGWDHQVESEAEKMEARERDLLERFSEVERS